MRTSAATVADRYDMRVIAVALPSNVSVFVKALHLLALAWIATVAGVWMALEPNRPLGADVLMRGGIPALVIVSFAWSFDRWTEPFRGSVRAHSAEWARALQWNIVPMIFLLVAAAAM